MILLPGSRLSESNRRPVHYEEPRGWLARRRVAIPVEIALFATGAAVFVLSAPSHDATYTSGIAICLPAAVVSAGTTALGMWLRRRRTAKA